jgi:hypothetical protein
MFKKIISNIQYFLSVTTLNYQKKVLFNFKIIYYKI